MDRITQSFRALTELRWTPYIDEKIKPVKEKQEKVFLHYVEKLKAHLGYLYAISVISGPLESEEATGWVSNIVITGKNGTLAIFESKLI